MKLYIFFCKIQQAITQHTVASQFDNKFRVSRRYWRNLEKSKIASGETWTILTSMVVSLTYLLKKGEKHYERYMNEFPPPHAPSPNNSDSK